jgi:hypothetical protein
MSRERDYFYIREEDYPTTVAYEVDWDASTDGAILVRYGVACCCARKDNFSKKLGRKIATGRLENKPSMLTVEIPVDHTGEMWLNIRKRLQHHAEKEWIYVLRARHSGDHSGIVPEKRRWPPSRGTWSRCFP